MNTSLLLISETKMQQAQKGDRGTGMRQCEPTMNKVRYITDS